MFAETKWYSHIYLFPHQPLIPNLFMEEFEVKALSSAPTPHIYG